MSSDSLNTPALPRGRIKVIVIVGVIAALAIVAAGVSVRAVDAKHLRSWTDAQAEPSVNLITPTHDTKAPALNLPGRTEAFTRAPIYARASGYLKSWSVDIGAPVKAGQLLGVIETPELDQQLLQARADLASSVANAQLAATTAHRWQAMLGSDSVSKQEVDERTGDLNSKNALVQAAQANVDRLVATKGFQRIVAPFDGVLTARDTDVGALINAGGAGQELFVVSDVRQLRVYVQLPQNYAPAVHIGTVATLTVPEYPNQKFTGKVVAKADAVNASSGTTLVQLLVDNQGNKLLPGAFANVIFTLPVQADSLRVPASALVFDGRGTTLATLGEDNKVHFKKITISRDFGESVEIGSGLAANDRVIDTPPDGLLEGDAVQIANKGDAAKKAEAHG